jgi:hypothetical protein
MARMRGRFLRAALPSPADIGHSFSTISNTFGVSLHSLDWLVLNADTLTQARGPLNKLESEEHLRDWLRVFCPLGKDDLRNHTKPRREPGSGLVYFVDRPT